MEEVYKEGHRGVAAWGNQQRTLVLVLLTITSTDQYPDQAYYWYDISLFSLFFCHYYSWLFFNCYSCYSNNGQHTGWLSRRPDWKPPRHSRCPPPWLGWFCCSWQILVFANSEQSGHDCHWPRTIPYWWSLFVYTLLLLLDYHPICPSFTSSHVTLSGIVSLSWYSVDTVFECPLAWC